MIIRVGQGRLAACASGRCDAAFPTAFPGSTSAACSFFFSRVFSHLVACSQPFRSFVFAHTDFPAKDDYLYPTMDCGGALTDVSGNPRIEGLLSGDERRIGSGSGAHVAAVKRPVGSAQAPGETQQVSVVQGVAAKSGEPETAADIDRPLVERSRNGDLEAFRQLVERYQNRAHSIALGVVGSREDAEDIVQEAFLKAFRNLGSFRGQSSFYTWFYRIVFNLAIDLSRKRYRRSESNVGDHSSMDALTHHSTGDASDFLGTVPNPDQAMQRTDIGKGIRKALDGLSAEHRAVIILREIDGLSYSEISDVVGCSKGTVMSRLHHARKRLQGALTEFMPPRLKAAGAAARKARAEEEDLLNDDEHEVPTR